jgi:hypothetical protein
MSINVSVEKKSGNGTDPNSQSDTEEMFKSVKTESDIAQYTCDANAIAAEAKSKQVYIVKNNFETEFMTKNQIKNSNVTIRSNQFQTLEEKAFLQESAKMKAISKGFLALAVTITLAESVYWCYN